MSVGAIHEVKSKDEWMKAEPVSSSFIFLSFSTSDGSVDAKTLRRRQGGAAPHPRRRELHRHGVRRARLVNITLGAIQN